MLWVMVLLVVAGLVFFKLGVLTVWLAVAETVLKVLFFASGLFLIVWAWRWFARRRRDRLVRVQS